MNIELFSCAGGMAEGFRRAALWRPATYLIGNVPGLQDAQSWPAIRIPSGVLNPLGTSISGPPHAPPGLPERHSGLLGFAFPGSGSAFGLRSASGAFLSDYCLRRDGLGEDEGAWTGTFVRLSPGSVGLA